MAEDRTQGWWKEFRSILPASSLDLAELEYHAAHLCTVEMVIIPGLLQTEEYARSVFSGAVTQRPTAEVDAAVRHRLKRRCIFECPSPTKLNTFLHEAALRIRYGNRQTMRGQLEHLQEAADQPMVTIRVIPFTAEEVTPSLQPLTYAGASVPQLDTVQVNNAFDGVFLDAAAQLEKYRALLDTVERIALGSDESKNLIHVIAKEM